MSPSSQDHFGTEHHRLLRTICSRWWRRSISPFLRWPNVSDYQPLVQTFYEDRNFEIAWTRDGKPTAAATGFIQAFADAGRKGLNPGGLRQLALG